MNTPNPARFDSVLSDLTAAQGAAASDVDKQLMLVKAQAELEDRRAAREEKARLDARASESRMQLLTTLATVFGPVLAGMVNRPAVPPELLAIIASGNKGSSMEDIKAMLEMQRTQATIQQEALVSGFKSVMATKDELSAMMLEKALEMGGGDNDDSIMGWLKDITKAAVPALLNHKAEQPAPAIPGPQGASIPQAHAAGNPPPATQRPNVRGMPPVLVVLKMMQQYRLGAFPAKEQQRIVKANMVSVILQDPQLSDLLNHADKTGADPVLHYCKPYVAKDPELVAFFTNGANQEWTVRFVEEILVPRIQDEMEDEDDIVVEGEEASASAGDQT